MEISGINLTDIGANGSEKVDKNPENSQFSEKIERIQSAVTQADKPASNATSMFANQLFKDEQLSQAFVQVQSQIEGVMNGFDQFSAVLGMLALPVAAASTFGVESDAPTDVAADGEPLVANSIEQPTTASMKVDEPTTKSVDTTPKPDVAEAKAAPQSEVTNAVLDRISNRLFDDGSAGLDDLVDVVNPAHHIPILSSVYSNVSGDEQGYISEASGGFLLGGPLGLAVTAANIGLDALTGKDFGEHVWNFVAGDD